MEYFLYESIYFKESRPNDAAAKSALMASAYATDHLGFIASGSDQKTQSCQTPPLQIASEQLKGKNFDEYYRL